MKSAQDLAPYSICALSGLRTEMVPSTGGRLGVSVLTLYLMTLKPPTNNNVVLTNYVKSIENTAVYLSLQIPSFRYSFRSIRCSGTLD